MKKNVDVFVLILYSLIACCHCSPDTLPMGEMKGSYMRCRKNVKNLTAAEKTAFVNAILILKAQPSVLHPADPTLRRYDDYVETHMNAMMANPGWAHGGPAFFPWHRELLLQFENDLRAIVPSVTIPYWDWTDSASSPFTADFLGGNSLKPNTPVPNGPFVATGSTPWILKVLDQAGDFTFLERHFGADPTASSLPTTEQVRSDMGATPYDSSPWQGASSGFRSAIELDVHNWVHRYVGGTMVNMTSPNDPVFWLHHCNIDRLWGIWQRQNHTLAAYLPQAGAPSGQNQDDNMIFNGAPPAPWVGSSTPKNVVDHHALGYWYDTDPIEITQITHMLTFKDIQEKDVAYQAISFEVMSALSQVTLSISALSAPFATIPLSTITVAAGDQAQTAHLWLRCIGTHMGDTAHAVATVSQQGTSNTWKVDLAANTVAQQSGMVMPAMMKRVKAVAPHERAKANFPLRGEVVTHSIK